MFQLPPVPGWSGFHPLVVHFPIALLLVAPLFVVLGIVLPRAKTRPYLMTALLLMILGTISLFVAVETGEAAGHLAASTPQIKAVLDQHEALAETAEIIFSGLTVILAAILFIPALLHRDLSRRRLAASVMLFLVLYGAGAVVLANTAHAGGRLVHELGVRATVAR